MLVSFRICSDEPEDEGLGGWDEEELEEDGVERGDGARVFDESREVDGEEFELRCRWAGGEVQGRSKGGSREEGRRQGGGHGGLKVSSSTSLPLLPFLPLES